MRPFVLVLRWIVESKTVFYAALTNGENVSGFGDHSIRYCGAFCSLSDESCPLLLPCFLERPTLSCKKT